MIQCADQLDDGACLESDICVVGAGPAGIALAMRAATRGLDVVMLESGGIRPDAESQSLCEGEVVDHTLHPPANRFRRRCLGGASVVWGGRSVPLDAIDFTPRPWLNLPSAWPIPLASLEPYWREAHWLADLGSFEYCADRVKQGGMRDMFVGFASASISTRSIERFSRPTDFGRAYGKRLRLDPRIRLVLRATCTNILLTQDCQAVAHMEAKTRAGTRFYARAKAYVLAAGGIEVPRLLLASRSQLAGGIGNSHDMVGRHYMTHLAGVLGRFVPAAGVVPFHGYDRSDAGVYCRRRLSVQPWAQRAFRIGNVVARLHHPSPADPSHRSGALSTIYLGRTLLPPEYRQRLEGTVSILPHICNILGDPCGTLRFAMHSLRYRYLSERKFPSVVVRPRNNVFRLDVHAEQIPNPLSRITLANSSDGFHVALPRIDWRYTPADIRSVCVTLRLIGDALSHGGQGILAFDTDSVEAELLRDGAYGGHHLGTARMSASPRTGVVNADCRVHGMMNLYIAGGAVFATSGQANPTLTILALALRLADHLVEIWPAIEPACSAGATRAPAASR